MFLFRAGPWKGCLVSQILLVTFCLSDGYMGQLFSHNKEQRPFVGQVFRLPRPPSYFEGSSIRIPSKSMGLPFLQASGSNSDDEEEKEDKSAQISADDIIPGKTEEDDKREPEDLEKLLQSQLQNLQQQKALELENEKSRNYFALDDDWGDVAKEKAWLKEQKQPGRRKDGLEDDDDRPEPLFYIPRNGSLLLLIPAALISLGFIITTILIASDINE